MDKNYLNKSPQPQQQELTSSAFMRYRVYLTGKHLQTP